MHTENQSEASRANGSKSHGPTTPEGKAASSQNALKHGLTARNPILVTYEDEESLNNLRQAYHAELNPIGQIESDIVEELASTKWRCQRGEAIEAAIISLTMARQTPDIDRCFVTCPAATKIALAYMHLIDESKSLATIQRQNSRLSRQFLKLLKTIKDLQAQRPNTPAPAPIAEPDPVQEPTPMAENQIEQNEPESAQPEPIQTDIGHTRTTRLNPAAWLATFLHSRPPVEPETKARAAGSTAPDMQHEPQPLENV